MENNREIILKNTVIRNYSPKIVLFYYMILLITVMYRLFWNQFNWKMVTSSSKTEIMTFKKQKLGNNEVNCHVLVGIEGSLDSDF